MSKSEDKRLAIQRKMRNVNRYGFHWPNFNPVGDRLIVRAMDEKDFDPDYSIGTVQDNYDNAIAFEVVQASDKVFEMTGIKTGYIIACVSPALDFTGQDRFYSLTLEDVIGWTTREAQVQTEEEVEIAKKAEELRSLK